MKLLIATVLLLASQTAFTQQSLVIDEKCKCVEVLNEVIEKLETNYIKHKELQLSNNLKDYEKQKSLYIKLATFINARDCSQFIGFFLDQFEDGHMYVFEVPTYTETEKSKISDFLESSIMSSEALKNLFETQSQKLEKSDKILGKYTDGINEIIVIKSENDYVAYRSDSIISKKTYKQLAKFNCIKDHYYSGIYYGYENEPRFIKATLFKDYTILSMGGVIWSKLSDSELVPEKNQNTILPTVENLGFKTVLVTIPSFIVDYQFFQTLLDENDRLFQENETLIVDIRGNRGGNAIYFPLIERYAINDTLYSSQGQVLASTDNKLYFEAMLRYNKDIYQPVVDNISNNKGKIVLGPKYGNTALDLVSTSIKNVAILTDGACASAAESFILHSKNVNPDVRTFGEPTEGMIDYTSVNSLKLKSSKDQNIYFGYPTSSLGFSDERHPNGFNEKGILPDVFIDEKVKNKYSYIIDFFSKK